MAEATHFDVLRIGIASPQDIRSWSKGEVKKPETINYRTFKPERDGLFCERIFGPTKDWECHCGKYKKIKFKGIICDRCGVEVTRAKVRRRRMGHIELAAPVAHLWYVKGVPSPMSLLLDISPRYLEKVLYFASYIITHADTGAISRALPQIRDAVREEIREVQEAAQARASTARRQLANLEQKLASGDQGVTEEDVIAARKRTEEESAAEEASANERIKELNDAVELLSGLAKHRLLPDNEYRALNRLMETVQRKLGKGYERLWEAGMGAEAVQKLLADIDLERLARELRKAIQETQGSRRARAIKRLEVVEAFRKSRNRPEWMIMEVIPIMPPELRPMVQLDGGRFATSDLNDLYRRIINRNNRLKRIIEIKAPESIINHEKRLLQEAVDALIDNGRRARPVTGSNGRPLKSLSDMLKGKEGRFRKNLLGKRVDYSGRSVIVVGPHLRLDQCGLPKEMAIELFKPFVMKRMVEKGYTTNIKTAKRMVDRMRNEVWDALEEVIKEHPVLLNRAPTLHRLGIQTFEPVLVDGKAIQIHPLVCPPFNADFDGDQMAVHVPLFPPAQKEARELMLSTHNLFSPAHGNPVMSPEYDIVLGCYYITQITGHPETAAGAQKIFADPQEALLAYEMGALDLHAPIFVRGERRGDDVYLVGKRVKPADREVKSPWVRHGDFKSSPLVPTTCGRLFFNEVLPEGIDYFNAPIIKKDLRELVTHIYRVCGNDATVKFLDDVKTLGFKFGTRAGLTISIADTDVKSNREDIIRRTEREVERINRQYAQGAITAGEREQQVCEYWIRATEEVTDSVLNSIGKFNPLYMMVNSGSRGNPKQVSQIIGMRGLMMEPSGRFIEDLPIKHNFHEGLSLLEYFISTHGARKGLADTALRTADAGYLTRRLVDVAQDVIIRANDCGTLNGIEVSAIVDGNEVIESLSDRLMGRLTSAPITIPTASLSADDVEKLKRLGARAHGRNNLLLVDANEEITPEMAQAIDDLSSKVEALRTVRVRSPLTCDLPNGCCAKCYGRDLSKGRLVKVGEAVGIIAAQSIGEPGTQLTMRTFHLGGVAGQYLTGVADVKKKKQEALMRFHSDLRDGAVKFDLTATGEAETRRQIQRYLKVLEEPVRGLLRVVELFEARKPKGEAIIAEYDGVVVDIESKGVRQVIIHSEQPLDALDRILGYKLAEDVINPKTHKKVLEKGKEITEKDVAALREAGVKKLTVRHEYLVPYRGNLKVAKGDHVHAGDRLTEGPIWPQTVLSLQGIAGVQNYLVTEIQKVYRSQSVTINDKHIETIVRQMLRKRRVKDPGDTELLPGQIIDRFQFEKENERVRENGGREATADFVLLGITEAALATESFLSAASFQKTTKVLTEAAIKGKEDYLTGLKENVIIGRLIPAGTGLQEPEPETTAVLVAGEKTTDDGDDADGANGMNDSKE
jgi:DNA-directed RNA polymerase subunit beta'